MNKINATIITKAIDASKKIPNFPYPNKNQSFLVKIGFFIRIQFPNLLSQRAT
jgi:hypothetical protein